ncbi:type IV pilin [Natrinema soli]|uniref:Type IV pilin n=1 Tax=Natrinema soli TaxID=1930624 RepID=A0ABD5SH25_9EURY
MTTGPASTGSAPVSEPESNRGISPVVGVLALVALIVCLAAVVAAGVGAWSLESPGPTASFELEADGGMSSIAVEHVAGDAIDVEALSVTIAVDGTELDAQPPIPFVGATGFDGAPDGPFNAKSDSTWTAGERAGVSIANNSPTLAAGDSVTVTLTVDGRRVATLETTAT